MGLITRSSLVAAGLLGTLAVAVSAQAEGPAGEVLLCHGTTSATSPYVLISVNANALHGHLRGGEPGHGWQNAPDFLLPAGFATCEDALGGGDDGGGDD
jgi:hypothetical protein